MVVLRYIRLLPLLVIVSFLSFAVRVGDIVAFMGSTGSAQAQEEAHGAQPPPLPSPSEQSAAKKEDIAPPPVTAPGLPALPPLPGAKVETKAADAKATTVKPEEKVWKSGEDTDVEQSDVKAALYKDMAARREELDKREKELATRQALLAAAEKEMDQKLAELTSIRNEIQGLLQTQNDEEKARIDSLVKVYENMKPKDAAAIFNTLDIDVLMRIMTKMSERKTAPILASMNEDRARTITTRMAEQKNFPILSPDGDGSDQPDASTPLLPSQ